MEMLPEACSSDRVAGLMLGPLLAHFGSENHRLFAKRRAPGFTVPTSPMTTPPRSAQGSASSNDIRLDQIIRQASD